MSLGVNSLAKFAVKGQNKVHIFSIIFPLVFIVLCGYLSSRSAFLSQLHVAGLSKFTFYISVPAFLFLNMSNANLQGSVSLDGFLSFYLPVLFTFSLANYLRLYKKLSLPPVQITHTAGRVVRVIIAQI